MVDFNELAVVVDDNGRVLAQSQGLGAREDMEAHLNRAKEMNMRKGTHSIVKRHRGGTVITGKDAEKALKSGRI